MKLGVFGIKHLPPTRSGDLVGPSWLTRPCGGPQNLPGACRPGRLVLVLTFKLLDVICLFDSGSQKARIATEDDPSVPLFRLSAVLRRLRRLGLGGVWVALFTPTLSACQRNGRGYYRSSSSACRRIRTFWGNLLHTIYFRRF